MATAKVYHWDYIAPGATVSVLMYGYSDRSFVSYSPVVYALQGDAYFPLGSVDMTVIEHKRYDDGTMARLVEVHNRAPFNPCAVDLVRFREDY